MVRIGTLLVSFEQREVHCEGRAMRVGARAIHILEVLYRASGTIVTKHAIMDAVWPGRVVEENRLQVHIAALRKLLGEDRELIKTVPGRGYMLVGATAAARDESRDEISVMSTRGLPVRPSSLIGRNVEVAKILALLEQVSVTTLTGAGGIGKTSLALHIAHAIREHCDRVVYFVELAKATSQETVLETLARAINADVGGENNVDRLANALDVERCLLVLDNAEHVADIAASLVETLVARNRALRVLVTSREPLHILAETVFRVDPLAVPAHDSPVASLAEHAAVELFMRRAQPFAPNCPQAFTATEATLPIVAEICRRLEGLPLAIELAAARVATLGIEGVASRLDDRLNLLTGGMRSALPRHQTLRATFDWSYALLDDNSRSLFRKLAFFTGAFSFGAVCAVATERSMAVGSIIASLGELAEKSMLSAELCGAVAQYRLTESTRAYAMERLRNEGEVQRVAERHMQYVRESIEQRSIDVLRTIPGSDVTAQLTLDDARAAFDWAFADGGNATLGVALAGSMVGALIEASLLHECRERAARALSGLNRLPRGAVDVLCEMRLHSAYAAASLHTSGDVNETEASWQRVLVLAHETGDTAFESRALWGMWNTMLTRADVHRSFRYATRFQQLAKRSESAQQNLYAEAMLAVSLHCFGEHEQARDRLERIVATIERAEPPLSGCGGLAVDPFVFASGTLARIAWLQGRSAEAMQRVEECINRIKPEMLEPSLSHLLAVLAIPIAILNGEFDTASRYLGLLRSQVALNRFDVWAVYGEGLGGYLDIATGRREAGLVRMESAIRDLEARGFRRLLTPMTAVWAQACAEAGRVGPAQKKLDEALAACRDGGEQFFVPELLRTLGVASFEYARTAQQSSELAQHHEEEGRTHLREAIRMAREQDAHMWELRATLDLAQHLRDRRRVDEAASLIEQIVLRADPNSNAPDVRRLVELRAVISRSLPQTRCDERETESASVRR